MSKYFSAYTYVQVECPTAQPGDELTGFVCIQANKSIKAMKLSICIKAKELTQWYTPKDQSVTYSDGINRSVSEFDWFSGKQVIFDYCIPLHNFNGIMLKGQYSIPFSIILPIYALPSFNLEKNFTIKRCYSIKSKLENSPNLKAKKHIIWIPSMLNELIMMSPILTENTINVKNCYCCGNDVSVVSLNLDKNAYFTNEKIIGSLIVDQKSCKKKLKSVRYSLLRDIRIKDKSMNSYFKSEVVMSVLRDLSVEDIKAGSVNSYDFEIDLNTVNELWEAPSTSSYLIECGYKVIAELKYDTFCSGMNYKISVYISIYNNFDTSISHFLMKPLALPDIWNPVVLEAASTEGTKLETIQ